MLKKLATILILFLVSCATSKQVTQKLYLDLDDDSNFLTLEQKIIITNDLQNIFHSPVELLNDNNEVDEQSVIQISIYEDEITKRTSYDYTYGAISISYSNVKTDFNSIRKYIKDCSFLASINKDFKPLSTEEKRLDEAKVTAVNNDEIKVQLQNINSTDGINREESAIIAKLFIKNIIKDYLEITGPIEKPDFYVFQGKSYGSSNYIYEIEIDKKTGGVTTKEQPISYKNFDSFKKVILEKLPPTNQVDSVK